MLIIERKPSTSSIFPNNYRSTIVQRNLISKKSLN